MDQETYKEIIRYHEETKHHFNRMATSSGSMDWNNQPNAFRLFSGREAVPLPFLKEDPAASYMDLYLRKNNKPRPFTVDSIAAFLELSLGLSSWKATDGSQWPLRINPSSGNLHPTESHLLVPSMERLKAGVYHYSPLAHSLEPRAEIPQELWNKVRDHFTTDGVFIALSTIFWRESWKYGERAFRYCNHDVGHALACLSFSANLQGWKITYLNCLSDDDVGTLLGFSKTQWKELEEEHPDLLCFVHSSHRKDIPRSVPPEIIPAFSKLTFGGTPNVLSQARMNWKIIYATADLTRKPKTDEKKYDYGFRGFYQGSLSALPASRIIRQRRSGVAYNMNGSITKDQLFAMLDKTIPRNDCAPFDVELNEPSVHLLLFIHHVAGLEQGLYFFLRSDKDRDEIKKMLNTEFLWRQIEPGFPLYLLKNGDFTGQAIRFSCHQEIAGYSAFSLGMIARFQETIEKEPYRYRHLFWETGMIGQILYLEAEAHGVRGTGIGCFFDDAVHDLLGLKNTAYQSLYHFTVGEPVEDARLTMHPPYYHLKSAQFNRTRPY